MARQSTLSIIILIFFCLLSFTKSDIQWINYDYSTNYVETKIINGPQKQTFGLDFSSGKSIPYYIKVEVTSKDDKPAPLLCFSNVDLNCREREQIIKNPKYKTVVM